MGLEVVNDDTFRLQYYNLFIDVTGEETCAEVQECDCVSEEDKFVVVVWTCKA